MNRKPSQTNANSNNPAIGVLSRWTPTEAVRCETPAFQAFQAWLEQDLLRLHNRWQAFCTSQSLRKDLRQGR